MCGIAGIYHFDTQREVDPISLKTMTNLVSHRGPDGESYYVHNNIGLGHRRLSIIDLSTGDQPMFNDDNSIALVFNGEIYNYLELREELISLGHKFRTKSDTEVIIRSYEQWGLKSQEKFNGMWAFALWDSRQQHMLLSRDRLGEKPLVYIKKDDSLVFGSEIKSILSFFPDLEPNYELLEFYLSLSFIPAPFTFFKG